MSRFSLSSALVLLLTSCVNNPVMEVNPFVGTALDGHTCPGAAAPFGLVQLSPDTPDGGVAGYHDNDRAILGFSHTHLSGTGEGDLGDFLFTPPDRGSASGRGRLRSASASFRQKGRERSCRLLPGGVPLGRNHC